MKKIIRLSVIFVLIVQLLMISACTNDKGADTDTNGTDTGTGVNTEGTGAAEVTTDYLATLTAPEISLGDASSLADLTKFIKAGSVYAYGDYYFYHNAEYELCYKSISNPYGEGTVISVGGDDGIVDLIMVDEEVSGKNGGTPVLFAEVRYKTDEGVSHSIVSYDLSTGEEAVIQEGIEPYYFEDMYLYGEYIFYKTSNEMLEESTLHRITKDGDGYVTLSDPDGLAMLIQTIYNDRIYYGVGTNAQMQLYAASLDFEDVEYLMPVGHINLSSVVIYNGYIIYPDNGEEVYEGTTEYFSSDLVCSPLDDLSTVYTIATGVYGFVCTDDGIYYTRTTPRSIGEDAESASGSDSGTYIMYCYSCLTGETTKIYDHSDIVIKRHTDFAGNGYIIFRDYYSVGSEYTYVLYNISTGEETEMSEMSY